MPTNRIPHLIAVGLVVTVSLVLLLAAQAGLTAAATDRSGASSSEALRGRVVIDCQGTVGPPPRTFLPRGRCTITGAILDRGKFFDDDALGHNPHGRTFFGAKGTIRFSVYRERRGHWRIIEGTRAYAGLRGRGWESPGGPCRTPGIGCRISLTMTGTVSQPTGRSGASARGSLRGEVRIHAIGKRLGTDQSGVAEGRFTISGVIRDRGRFVDNVRLNVGYVRTLFGAKGTIEIFAGLTPNWRIIKGTRAYSGLRGRGTQRGQYRFVGIDATMIGTVWR